VRARRELWRRLWCCCGLGHGLPHAHPDPLVLQYVDDAFSTKLAYQRRDGKTHLELIL
jgi:hypothetical protein